MTRIALNHLEPIQKAQLMHCRPDLFTRPRCKRCGGSVFINYGEISCINCGAEHDEDGNWMAPRMGMEAGERQPRLQRRRKIR